GGTLGKLIVGLLAALFVILLILGWYWSREPGLEPLVQPLSVETPQVIGSTTARSVHGLMTTLLDKPGGFLSNDIMPPGVWLDNMPSWEFGVLVQVRDMTRALRRDM